MNKRKAVALALAWLLLSPGVPALALEAEELVPMGSAVGIRLQTEGVMVAGLADVETAEGTLRPAEAAGLRLGDVVTAVDGKRTDSAAAFLTALSTLSGAPVDLTVARPLLTLVEVAIPAIGVEAFPEDPWRS